MGDGRRVAGPGEVPSFADHIAGWQEIARDRHTTTEQQQQYRAWKLWAEKDAHFRAVAKEESRLVADGQIADARRSTQTRGVTRELWVALQVEIGLSRFIAEAMAAALRLPTAKAGARAAR